MAGQKHSTDKSPAAVPVQNVTTDISSTVDCSLHSQMCTATFVLSPMVNEKTEEDQNEAGWRIKSKRHLKEYT